MNRKFNIRLQSSLIAALAVPMTIAAIHAGAGPALGQETQGPVRHEAASSLSSSTTSMGLAGSPSAPEAPPPPKAEAPGRAARLGLVFVPGYWIWSDGDRRYDWVAGIWREPPPNRVWVAGLWLRDQDQNQDQDQPQTQTQASGQGGWRWSRGFWSRIDSPKLEYRASGPPDAGPSESSGSPPIPESFRVSGHYRPDGANKVIWQPGFWSRTRPGWTWSSPRWAERDLGWVFVPGYWERSQEPAEPDPARDPIVALISSPTKPTPPPGLVSSTSMPTAAPCSTCRKPTVIVQGPPLWLRGIGLAPGAPPLFPYRPYLYNNPYHYALANGGIPSRRSPGSSAP